MILTALIAFGLAAACGALTLARMDLALTRPRGAVAAPFAAAAATMTAWTAYGALILSGLIALGIPVTIVLAAAPLILGRLTPARPLFTPLVPLRGPLATVAMGSAIAALLWTLSLIQGVSHG